MEIEPQIRFRGMDPSPAVEVRFSAHDGEKGRYASGVTPL